MKRLGTIIVLSGPSGVGKSTLVERIRAELPELEFSISCTTRAPRAGELNGVHYHFLSQGEFERRVAAGEFIEHAGVFAHHYGTLKSEVLDRIRNGSPVVLDIDVQGAMQIREAAGRDPEIARSAVFVFIGPPSAAKLEARLRGRATDSEEQIRMRLDTARRELACWKKYDYLVINDNLDRATAELAELFRSFRLRTAAVAEEPFS